MNKQTKFITTTGLLIALTIVFQLLSKFVPLGPFSNFITGSLVNACLLISTSLIGLWGGTIVGIVTPFGALLTGSAIPLLFTPIISICNFSLVLSFSFLKKHKLINIIVPPIIKTFLLYASINMMISIMKIPSEKSKIMLYLFGWPQLVTGLIGGTIAMIIVNRLKNHINLLKDC